MIKATNQSKIRYLIFVLFMPVLINGVNSFLMSFLGFSGTSLVTLAITGMVALWGWILMFQGVKTGSLFLWFSVIFLFVLNFVVFDYSREYLLDISMLIIYVFYLPISVMLIRDIEDWSDFISGSKPFCYLTSVISVFIILLTDYSTNLNYMEFSYAVLPFVMLGYVLFRNNPRLISGISLLAICLCIVIFGARATILFTLAFVFYCEFFVYKDNVARNVIFLLLAVLLIVLYFVFQDAIVQWASELAETTESYFLKKLTSGEIFTSSGRDGINEKTSYALSQMGLNIYGLFGDRYSCGIIYAHNIAIEIFLSFGWIIGSVIIAVALVRVLLFYLRNRSQELTVIFGLVLLSMFARYIISGSFVIEGKFYICVAMLSSMMRIAKLDKRERVSACCGDAECKSVKGFSDSISSQDISSDNPRRVSDDIQVSVLCAVYNHEKYLRGTLQSFVDQKVNFKFEVIVHDDASTDASAEIIREFEEKYPDIIKPIYQTKNQYSQGISVMKEFLFPRVRGKYIASCEGDDYWTDDSKLQRQFDFLEEHPDYSMVAHLTRVVDDDDNFMCEFSTDKKTTYEKGELIENLDAFQTSSFFYRAEARNKNSEFLDRSPAFDYVTKSVLSTEGKIYIIQRTMSAYRKGSVGSWTLRVSKNAEKYISHIQLSIEFFKDLNEYTNYEFKGIIDKQIKRREFMILCEERSKSASRKIIKEYKDQFRALPFKSKLYRLLLALGIGKK